MKPRTFIYLAVAVLCGLGAAILAAKLTAKPAEGDTVDVIVAKDFIAQGSILPKEDPLRNFEMRQYKKEEVPPNARLYPKDEKGREQVVQMLSGKMMKRGLPAKLPLTDWHLGKAVGVQVNIPDGFRAMSLPANVSKDGGGWVLPNSHVDIICIFAVGNGRILPFTILQNVLVLSVNQTEDTPENATSLLPNNVTLAVKPEQAELLAAASSKNALAMTLRKAGDDTIAELTPERRKMFDKLISGESADGTPEVPLVESVQVVVAAKDIEEDTVITNPSEYFKVVPFPKDVAPAQGVRYTNLNELTDTKTVRRLRASQVVSKDDLVNKDTNIAHKPGSGDPEVFVQSIVSPGREEKVTYDKNNVVVGPKKK